jgi:hypothetical protein
LSDKAFNRKFRASSFDERLFTKMDQQTDEVRPHRPLVQRVF